MNRDYRKAVSRRREPEVQAYARPDRAADLQVLYSGYQACLPSHRWQGRRDHALLHYILTGQGRVRSRRRDWTLGPGDCFLFRPESELWYQADGQNPWSYTWIGFTGLRLSSILDRLGFSSDATVISGDVDGATGNLFLSALERCQSSAARSPVGALELQGILAQILARLTPAAGASEGPKPETSVYVDEILGFLNQTYGRRLTTETIAEFAGLERTYCCHLFAQQMGQGLMDYLTNLRVEKARELLRTTRLSVRAVAESVGYTDPGTFSKRFRQRTGLSPSDSRRGAE